MTTYRSARRFWVLASPFAALLTAGIILRATPEARQARPTTASAGRFTGRVVSASGLLAVGGTAVDPGHPVAGATVHLVPVTAIDVTSRMTASAIYAPPYPAEAYDEPLEDTIRLRGATFPQAITDARGGFTIANVPDGKFFVHVTPAANDAEHLPGGDVSRQGYPAEQLRGTIDDDRGVEQPVREGAVHR